MKLRLQHMQESMFRPHEANENLPPEDVHAIRRRILGKFESMSVDQIERAGIPSVAHSRSSHRLETLLLDWAVELTERLGQWVEDAGNDAEKQSRLQTLMYLLVDEAARPITNGFSPSKRDSVPR